MHQAGQASRQRPADIGQMLPLMDSRARSGCANRPVDQSADVAVSRAGESDRAGTRRVSVRRIAILLASWPGTLGRRATSGQPIRDSRARRLLERLGWRLHPSCAFDRGSDAGSRRPRELGGCRGAEAGSRRIERGRRRSASLHLAQVREAASGLLSCSTRVTIAAGSRVRSLRRVSGPGRLWNCSVAQPESSCPVGTLHECTRRRAQRV